MDADPQGSSMQAYDTIPGVDILPYEEKKLIENQHEIIFIDTPPYIAEGMRKIFLLSDLVIVPTRASVPDIMAIRSTMALLKEAQQGKKN